MMPFKAPGRTETMENDRNQTFLLSGCEEGGGLVAPHSAVFSSSVFIQLQCLTENKF